MTKDEKIKFYDKVEKALRIEHPVIVYGLTKQQIIELIKTMLKQAKDEINATVQQAINNATNSGAGNGSGSSSSNLFIKHKYNSLEEFKTALSDTTYEDGDSISIGDDVYILKRDNTETADDKYYISDPVGGNWVRNEGTVVELNPITDFNLTIQDGELAWSSA